jgi:hypothetical protein
MFRRPYDRMPLKLWDGNFNMWIATVSLDNTDNTEIAISPTNSDGSIGRHKNWDITQKKKDSLIGVHVAYFGHGRSLSTVDEVVDHDSCPFLTGCPKWLLIGVHFWSVRVTYKKLNWGSWISSDITNYREVDQRYAMKSMTVSSDLSNTRFCIVWSPHIFVGVRGWERFLSHFTRSRRRRKYVEKII